MHDSTLDTDILIVGAGPVGLFLANECARRGLRFRVVEARPGQSEHSKALAIFPRTMEIFDMAGLVDPFLGTANRVTSVQVVTSTKTLAHMRFEPHESPYSFVSMVPQDVTEKLLVEALQERGGHVEYETSLVATEQNGERVIASLEHKGQRLTLSAAYLVGCDGAHSAVRHLLNLPFEGAEYNDLFILADAETNDALPADQLQLCPSEYGPVAIFPMSATRRRIVATVERADPTRLHLRWFSRSCASVVQRDSKCAACSGALISASIIARWRSCAWDECLWPAMPPTFTARSAGRA